MGTGKYRSLCGSGLCTLLLWHSYQDCTEADTLCECNHCQEQSHRPHQWHSQSDCYTQLQHRQQVGCLEDQEDKRK